MLMGLAWTSENRDTHSGSWCHSDNIMGTPSSLSDERIKENVSSLEPSNCLSLCNSLNPTLYLQTLDNEVRAGLIAQEVQTALQNHNLPDTPVLDTKWATADNQLQELMSMRYERLVPMLLGAVKELTRRIQELESKYMDFKKHIDKTMHFVQKGVEVAGTLHTAYKMGKCLLLQLLLS